MRESLEQVSISLLPPQSKALGVIDFDVELEMRRTCVDWDSFLQTRDLAESFPKIRDDVVIGEIARSALYDAQEMLEDLSFSAIALRSTLTSRPIPRS